MSNTTSTADLRSELWQRELFEDVIDGLYFTQYDIMGEGDNHIVCLRDGLMKNKGDGINVGLTTKLTGNGITGDSELEGNEEAISSYAERVAIDQVRHAVRLTGVYDEQINSYDMREDSKKKLSIWFQEFIQMQIFLKLGGVTNASIVSGTGLTDVNGIYYAQRAIWSNIPDLYPAASETAGTGDRYLSASADGIDGLLATEVITPAFIQRLKTKAKLAAPKLVPLTIKGTKHYVLFVHPWVADDLRNDSTYLNATRDAQARGADNPIFTAALGMWGSVILIEHEYVPTGVGTAKFDSNGTGIASTVRCFRNLLCGCQAAVFARSKPRKGFVEKEFDYGNQMGYASSMIGGIQKLMFNAKEYGVIAFDTGATAQ